MGMTAEQYISLTRVAYTTQHAVLIAGNGQAATIPFEEIPTVLNAVTPFKWYWREHFFARRHIEFEQLDEQCEFAKMEQMLAPQGYDEDEAETSLGDFLRFHMKMTAPTFTWNFEIALNLARRLSSLPHEDDGT